MLRVRDVGVYEFIDAQRLLILRQASPDTEAESGRVRISFAICCMLATGEEFYRIVRKQQTLWKFLRFSATAWQSKSVQPMNNVCLAERLAGAFLHCLFPAANGQANPITCAAVS